MKKLFLFLCAAALLTASAFADGGPDAGSCEHYFEVTVEQDAGCTDIGLLSYVCNKCGAAFSMEAPATGHNYVYQYDAAWDGDGTLLTYGTWRCARCGDTLDATAGNAAYYYSSADIPAQDIPAPAATPSIQQTDPAAQAVAEARNGLWTAIAVGAAVLLIAEAVILTRTLGRDRYSR